jgi:pyrimidine deaminase RibD-like protein
MEENPAGTINNESQVDVDCMRQCITLAYKCKSAPTAYNVGAVLVCTTNDQPQVLTTGFSRELLGNTHAEECCLLKLDKQMGYSKESRGVTLLEYAKQQLSLHESAEFTMYTSMEPCSLRTSGKKSCSSWLQEVGVHRVVVGAMEPDLFVDECQGVVDLKAKGIQVHVMHGLEYACLAPNLHLVADDQEGDMERLVKRHRILQQVVDEVDDNEYGEKEDMKRRSTFPLTVVARRSMEAIKSIWTPTKDTVERGTSKAWKFWK